MRFIKRNMKVKTIRKLLIFIILLAWFFSGWPQVWRSPRIPYEIKQAMANPDVENLWSESNTAPSLTLTNSTNANGSTTGSWANASGKWAKYLYYWEFVMQNSGVGTGTINSVVLYLKHYQSGWANDDFLIQIYDGSTWIDVQTYISGSGSPAPGIP